MKDEIYASFWTHIEDLRRTILKMLMIIVIGVILSFICYEPIITFLTKPLINASTSSNVSTSSLIENKLEFIQISNQQHVPITYQLPTDALQPINVDNHVKQLNTNTYEIAPGGSLNFAKRLLTAPLIVLGPLEGILIALKTSVWIGIVSTSPLWLFTFFQFIAPALRAEEAKLIWPFLLFSMAFIAIGCGFAYLITIPIANTYLTLFNASIGINLWSLTHYLDYTVFLLLANGLAFELAVIGLFAVQLGLVSAEMLAAKRRYAIVGTFIIGALLTPPDVLTQIMLAVPLIMLYEVLIIYARLRSKLHQVRT